MSKNIVAAQVNWSEMAGTTSSYWIDVRDYLGEEADIFGAIVRCHVQDENFVVESYDAQWNEAKQMHLLTLPGMVEGRHAFDITLIFDSGEEAVLAQGWIGCFNRLQWSNSANVHASPNRTLVIPRADSKGLIKVQWMASGAAEGFADIAKMAAEESEASAAASANSASEALGYRNETEVFASNAEAAASTAAAEAAEETAALIHEAVREKVEAAEAAASTASTAANAAESHLNNSENFARDAEAAMLSAQEAQEAAESAYRATESAKSLALTYKTSAEASAAAAADARAEARLSASKAQTQRIEAEYAADAAKQYSDAVIDTYWPKVLNKSEEVSDDAEAAKAAATKAEAAANSIDTKVTEAANAIDTKVETAANSIDSKVTEATGAIDGKVTEATGVIDDKVLTAEGAIDASVAAALAERIDVSGFYRMTQEEYDAQSAHPENAVYFIGDFS